MSTYDVWAAKYRDLIIRRLEVQLAEHHLAIRREPAGSRARAIAEGQAFIIERRLRILRGQPL